MEAFINTPISKDEFLKELKWHQEQDRFLKGTYRDDESEEFRGCAVGCSINSIAIKVKEDLDFENHSLYEKYLGIPKWLAHCEDVIFEGLPTERAKSWPVEFAEAINVGADLNKIKPAFMIFVLEECLQHVQGDEFRQQREAIENVIKLWERDDRNSPEWKIAARAAARDAAWAARDAAWDAARAAARDAARAAARAAARDAACDTARAAARDAACDTARAAARAAASAAAWATCDAARAAARDAACDTARDAARAAAWAACDAAWAACDAAWAACDTAWAARDAYERFADKLLELIKSEKEIEKGE